MQVPTGIVLAGDSRATGESSTDSVDPSDPNKTIKKVMQLMLSDAANKVFKVHGRFGVGVNGAGTIASLPVAHYIEKFELDNQQPATNTTDLANAILTYFRNITPIPACNFTVVGFDGEPFLFTVDVSGNSATRQGFDGASGTLQYGPFMGGDIAIVQRLLSDPTHNPPFQLMNIQDAADFARHLIRTTIDQLRFEPRFATVGGPIDTLVVTPAGCAFIEQKALVAR